jgi:small subunit ribosomal protein S20
MANIRSAEKRNRQAEKQKARNRAGRSALRTQVKKFREALESGDTAAIAPELQTTYSLIDKAARKGLIHENTANRTKSRLAAAAKRSATA